jgi:RHS repeat-associated protein
MIVIGGFQYISSDAIMKKSEGKQRIQDAVIGLVLVISAWLILNTINPNLVTPTIQGYTGHEYDAQSDLTYAHARYINNTKRIFLSQDPMAINGFSSDRFLLDPQAQNSYSYGKNNPVNNVDPDGKFVDAIFDLAFMAYDGASYAYHSYNGQETEAKNDLVSLGLNTTGLSLPGVTGLGVV